MAIDLNRSLAWTSANAAENAMLDDLQANILKGHGRLHTANAFFKFDNADDGRAFLGGLASSVTSASKQLQETVAFRQKGTPGDPVLLVFLTHAGYSALGIPTNQTPTDEAFVDGMAARQEALNDPDKSSWDKHLSANIHAMILLADTHGENVQAALKLLLKTKSKGVVHLGTDIGLGMKSLLSEGEGIEHFGYVDGRSQPLILREDVERERDARDGISVWNPEFPLKTALVNDPGGKSEFSFGSYFVYRKLEQNVRAFKKAEKNLAKALNLRPKQAELAGAMIVGRFEDGTPVVLQKEDGINAPVMNNFDYKDDEFGSKCPFHSHIRKTNPRGDSGILGAPLEDERSHIMARRGITYGKRLTHPNSKSLTIDEMPTKGVGLLFMAYQNNIQNQFEFTQRFWANNQNFVHDDTGIDPVIGQGPSGGQACPVEWGGGEKTKKMKFDFRNFVSMKGGEYFFAPSLSMLKSLSPRPIV
ncbi:Dyp-type peroxidase [Hyphomonas chukchiensis]|uniref:Peroxidase n=1 Tax=Hyphomonas chukchiensis TaxID=1280947 RepID=A0A062UHK1_9PROT|nr:hypothetical protein [Hyphomonas chukchiensis]KCZ56064.1 hypothetical protein HY30_07355 [Hyphomonas chukchiensis]